MSDETDPQAFNEDWYLRNNPDVVAAIARGDWKTGRDHYEFYGKKEGRRGNEDMPRGGQAVEPAVAAKKRTTLDRILRSTSR